MRRLRSVLMIGCMLGMLLSACGTATQETTPVPTPLQAAAPSVTALPTDEPLAVAMPAIAYIKGRNELMVVSSVTGAAYNAFPPILLGYYYSHAFAPDGHTLAVISDTKLLLVDLQSWKVRTSDVGIRGWMSAMVYSPDGSLLALAYNGPEGELRIVDAKSGKVMASAQAGFAVKKVKFTSDEKGIMVYGPHLASTGEAANAGVSVGAPKAALFATQNLSLLWSVELSSVRDGTFPKKPETTITQDIYQPGAASHFEPGVAFAPTQDVLYIVHGDSDLLTRIDFTDKKIHTLSVHAALSWIDQLLALTAGVATAKGMDGTTKQATISPDGKYLYVVGSTETVALDANGTNWNMEMSYIGLQVIDAQDGTLLDQKGSEAYSLALSPDGRQVLLSGWGSTAPAAWTEVYDPATKSIIKHINSADLVPTRRLDGKALAASSSFISDNLCEISTVDPNTWATVGKWKQPNCIDWLVDP